MESLTQQSNVHMTMAMQGTEGNAGCPGILQTTTKTK